MTERAGGSNPSGRTMEKLYVVVRADLPAGAQVAQSVHAAVAFALEYRTLTDKWHGDSNNLVVLSVPDLSALETLCDRLPDEAKWVVFEEPDFDNQLTAIAFEGTLENAKLVSSLSLALKEVSVN